MTQKPQYSLLHDEDLPDLKTLATVVRAYRAMESTGGYKHLAVVAKEVLDIDKDTMSRRINRFEKAFGKKILERGRGRGASRFREDEDVRDLICEVERLLGIFEARYPKAAARQRPLLVIGVSESLLLYWAHDVVARLGDDRPFDVVFRHALPQELSRRGLEEGEFDLVLASHDPKNGDDAQVKHKMYLNLYLLIHRRHKLAMKENVDWESREVKDALKDMTYVLQDTNRRPFIPVPLSKIPQEARVVRVESYLDAYAMVMAGGNVCCFGFPQILSPYQLSELRALRPEWLGDVTFALIRPNRARDKATMQHNQCVERLAREYNRRMIALNHVETDAVFSRELRRTFHVARDPQRGDFFWVPGRLDNLVVASDPDRTIYADHFVETDDPLGFSVTGNISKGRLDELGEDNVRHLVLKGHKRYGSAFPNEEYAISLCGTKSTLQHGPVVAGVWLGRCTWDKHTIVPDAGWFLLTYPDVKVSDFERYIKEDPYWRKYREKDPFRVLPLPDKVKSPGPSDSDGGRLRRNRDGSGPP